MTGESLDVLAGELDRVLAQRRVDPVAAAAVLERAVAACRSDPAAADLWHLPELLDELVDIYEQLGAPTTRSRRWGRRSPRDGTDARTAAAGSPNC